MKLLVIGHSVVDYINFEGEKSVKPGGIFYSVSSLNNFKENQDKISLVTAVDKKHYILFKDVYDKLNERIFNNVDPIPKVWLEVERHSERHEKYENINQNLNFRIEDINSFDGILINMITGFDINLHQLKDIRESYNGLIYFDVHTFSRGLDKNFVRHFRVIPDFKEWASNLDIIQVNKSELKTLSKKESDEDIINEMFSYGIKYLVLTLEDEGAKVFFKKNNLIKSVHEPAIKITVKNKIGCGDVFGSVFFYSYIKYKSIIKALKLANTAAGFSASYNDINNFKSLKKDVFARYN